MSHDEDHPSRRLFSIVSVRRVAYDLQLFDQYSFHRSCVPAVLRSELVGNLRAVHAVDDEDGAIKTVENDVGSHIYHRDTHLPSAQKTYSARRPIHVSIALVLHVERGASHSFPLH